VNESLRHHLNKHLDNIPDGATYGRTYGTFTSKVGSDGKFTGSTVLNKQASIAILARLVYLATLPPALLSLGRGRPLPFTFLTEAR